MLRHGGEPWHTFGMTLAQAAAAASGADADTVAMVGASSAAAEQGYAAAKKAAAGGVSLGETVGLTMAGAAAGSAIMPGIGTAIGAIAGLAVSLGVTLADWFDGTGASVQPVELFDRFAVVKRPARLGKTGGRATTWTLGPSVWEKQLQGKKVGQTDLGTILWALRRAREDGGGGREFARILGAAGVPYEAPDPAAITPEDANEAGAPISALWASLPFVPPAKRRVSDAQQTYMGARALGLDVPAARELAGLPPDRAAELFLQDLRARIERELPPAVVAAPTIGNMRNVPASVLRHVADLVQGKVTIQRIDPAVLRRGVGRSMQIGESEAPVLLVGGLGALALGWYFLRGRK